MRDETLLGLLDVLDGLTLGYKECAQKIYAAEYALLGDHKSEAVARLCGAYVQTKRHVMSGEPGLGVEFEKWNELAGRIETTLATLRKKLLQS